MLSLLGAAAVAGVVRPEAGSFQPWLGWPTISSWWAMTTRRQVGVAARRAAPRCLASSPQPIVPARPRPPPASGRAAGGGDCRAPGARVWLWGGGRLRAAGLASLVEGRGGLRG